ncbi:kelch-like protein 2 [Acyrthosiphon pisum]|uniref:BTB domain-containing protein n=1 Tax=Acyrthosiphon pisum TaxID=7029 RepID=A0A8R1X0Z8_ACYPI|nr:kelch-like protein 2 [Acyrthosiphon pisum]|eukprot:XP_008179322.1 PREDICTED: kelch-like protein 2 [Acyrthosiphon pisum]
MDNSNKIPESSRCELAKYEYKQSSYAEIFKVLQSLRKQQLFCDIKLRTDDGGVIFGHKVVLASASPYFHEMFTNFEEKNQDIVLIKHFDSTTLLHLVDYIYTGEIVLTEYNVKVMIPAVNILQLQEVKAACCDFLQKQLSFTNCICIYSLADLHSCTELLTSSELYIQQHFADVVVGNEFLFLSSEQIDKLIGSNELEVPSEEKVGKVFENVIRWVKHDLGSRKCILPKLMEHVRLPLTSKKYILKKVVEEPLINNCLKCKDNVIEALNFYLLKSDELTTIPHNVRTKPRHPGGLHKVILVVGGLGSGEVILDSTEWYYPKINKWQSGPKMITPRCGGGISVVKDNFVFYMGGINNRSSRQSIEVLDLSSESPCWKPTVTS